MYDLRRVMPWRHMPRSLYFPYMHRRLEHTLTRAVVRIAYPEAWEENGQVFSGNSRHILGYIIAEPSKNESVGLITHYLYTRRDYTQKGGQIKACYRNQGIARALLQGMLDDYGLDHVTFTVFGQELHASDALFNRVFVTEAEKWTYNPELFTTLLPHEWEKGIAATLNPAEATAYNSARQYSPVSF